MHERTSMWGFLPECNLHEGKNLVTFACTPPEFKMVPGSSSVLRTDWSKRMNDHRKERQ